MALLVFRIRPISSRLFVKSALIEMMRWPVMGRAHGMAASHPVPVGRQGCMAVPEACNNVHANRQTRFHPRNKNELSVLNLDGPGLIQPSYIRSIMPSQILPDRRCPEGVRANGLPN